MRNPQIFSGVVVVAFMLATAQVNWAAQDRFVTARHFAAGHAPFAVAVADLNGDNKLDLVVANQDGNQTSQVNILLGNGDGTFRRAKSLAAGPFPDAVAAADLNHDGKLDLVVVDFGGFVSILLGNGDGTFQKPKRFAVGNYPAGVAIGDLNGDGNLDLVVSNPGGGDPPTPGSVSILLGNGDGTFQPQKQILKNTNPVSVVLEDFNGDGKLDLAVANEGPSAVNVLFGNGDGTFHLSKNYFGFNTPAAIAAQDVNGDNKLDLVVTDVSGNSVGVMLGKGDGTFRAPKISPAGVFPFFFAMGDFNHDNKMDLAVVDTNGYVSILLGKGDGTFHQTVSYDAGSFPIGIAAADFTGDHKLDLIVADNHQSLNTKLPGFVSLLRGKGDGTFEAAKNFPFGQEATPLGGVAGDFNRDGKLDLAFANGTGGGVTLLQGKGDGTFQPPTTIVLGNVVASSIIEADFNHDGKLDLAVTSYGFSAGSVSILLGNGNGTFQPAITYPVGNLPLSMAAGDFNNDGNLDLVVANAQDVKVSVLLGNGDGTFKSPLNVPFQHAYNVGVGDFNGDGKLDMVVTDHAAIGGIASLFLGKGDGTFQPPVNLSVAPTSPGFVLAADFNADHKLDLAIAIRGGADVLVGNGDGTFQSPVFIAYNDDNGGGAIPPPFLAAADFDGDGKLDLVSADQYDESATLVLGNGDGSFQKPQHFPVGGDAYSAAVGDFDGDKAPDLAVGLEWFGISSGVTVLLNTEAKN